jgi:hypothetical protein
MSAQAQENHGQMHHDQGKAQDESAQNAANKNAKNSVEPILPGLFADGTSLEPSSSPRWMLHENLGKKWTMMLHGQGFLTYTASTGPLGQEKLFSTNWIMAGFERPLAGGKLTIRTMFSLEPLTITNRQYPLLFQTGETAYGIPLWRGQHPHDFFMGEDVMYTRNIGNRATVLADCGLVSAPALGSPAFMHSVTGSEMSEAWITHHENNSTHTSSSVCTAGFSTSRFMVEGSIFHGHEPDEHRWKLRLGVPDSWSTRFTLALSKNFLGQISYGHLHAPETPLEQGDVERTTASVIYNRPLTNGNWATTAAWGMNHHCASRKIFWPLMMRLARPYYVVECENLSGFALESNLQFRKHNYLFGRIEAAEKDSLLPGVTRVEWPIAFTIGYARDIKTTRYGSMALTGDTSFYKISPTLHAVYGNPLTFRVGLRFRLGSQMSHDICGMAGMDHAHMHHDTQ